MSERLASPSLSSGVATLPEFSREGKPRDKGLTFASDDLKTLGRDYFADVAEYVDCIKIGQSLPLLLDRSKLLERIRFFHDCGVRVQSGGTLIQVAYKKRILPQILERLRAVGFDLVEISESATEIPRETKQDIVSLIRKLSMDYIFEVGRKDPGRPQPTSQLISKIEEALEFKSPKVVIEAGNGKGVGMFDQLGDVVWNNLNDIVGRFGPPSLIFEAPLESQRIALTLEFGPNVNLASVPVDRVLTLEMQRLGLTTETLGVAPPVQSVNGSPASKFVFHLIKTEHPIDQQTLIQRSGLPKRTLQAALSYLVEKGFVREVPDMSDLRRHKYTPKS
ncbi:MAG TPA: phosphosulfolactate synthase [Nitrososphaerales archaeon]|nr:phosphosulfolactate synthase [Nitrososphaerales archaeon]